MDGLIEHPDGVIRAESASQAFKSSFRVMAFSLAYVEQDGGPSGVSPAIHFDLNEPTLQAKRNFSALAPESRRN